MKKIGALIILTGSLLNSFAQTGCYIKKAYAYFAVTVPGMLIADENGNPVPPVREITRFIYFEWDSKNAPVLRSIMYNDVEIPASLVATDSSSVIVGNSFETGERVMISAKKCNQLWKIELRQPAGNAGLNLECKNILLKIAGSGKVCEFGLKNESQLMSLPRY